MWQGVSELPIRCMVASSCSTQHTAYSATVAKRSASARSVITYQRLGIRHLPYRRPISPVLERDTDVNKVFVAEYITQDRGAVRTV